MKHKEQKATKTQSKVKTGLPGSRPPNGRPLTRNGCGVRISRRTLSQGVNEVSLEAVASAAGEPAVNEVLQEGRWLDTPAPGRFLARTEVAVSSRCTGTAHVLVANGVREKKQL